MINIIAKDYGRVDTWFVVRLNRDLIVLELAEISQDAAAVLNNSGLLPTLNWQALDTHKRLCELRDA